jgi:hypothetical protein
MAKPETDETSLPLPASDRLGRCNFDDYCDIGVLTPPPNAEDPGRLHIARREERVELATAPVRADQATHRLAVDA